MQDFDGLAVIDADGNEIGTVEQTFDDQAGIAQFVAVRTGSLLFKHHRLVPVDGVQQDEKGLRVSYSKQMIDGSPDASSAGDSLEGDLLERVRSYYRGGQDLASSRADSENADVAAVPTAETGEMERTGTDRVEGGAAPSMGAVRDLGDVIEVPIVEEEVVTRPVVKEVLRIRKTQSTESRTVGADVRKEDIEVTREGDTGPRSSDQ